MKNITDKEREPKPCAQCCNLKPQKIVVEYYVQCSCGNEGHEAPTIEQAMDLWDAQQEGLRKLQEKQMNEVNICPFCGSVPKMREDKVGYYHLHHEENDCILDGLFEHWTFDTKEQMLTLWNKRVIDPSTAITIDVGNSEKDPSISESQNALKDDKDLLIMALKEENDCLKKQLEAYEVAEAYENPEWMANEKGQVVGLHEAQGRTIKSPPYEGSVTKEEVRQAIKDVKEKPNE